MSLPQRNSGSFPMPAARAGANSGQTLPAYEVLKVRVLMKLQDKLDPARAKRMPESLLKQTARQTAEQIVDADFPRMNRADRDRLILDVLSEAFGFGPLEELFGDATVKEILVLGPQAVVVRREQGWLPTNVKFLDTEHLQETLDKVVLHGEVVSPGLPSSALDTKLPNGFRAVAVIPPPVLDQSAIVLFTRVETPAAAVPLPPMVPAVAAPPPPVSGPKSGKFIRQITPEPRQSPLDSTAPGEGALARHRTRIMDRLTAKMAQLGVYDLQRVEITELRKVIAAYIREYCDTERILLSDVEQGRLMLEILTAMHR